MDIASIDNKIVWTCNKCRPSEVTSSKTKLTGSQLSLPSIPQSRRLHSIHREIPVVEPSREPNLSEVQQPLPGPAKVTTLTTEQIASRHVVTKDLPIFDGKPEEWPMFISRFNNSTKLCGFSDSENLDRLQKCLKGNAKDAVKSRLLTAEAVPGIISTLKMLYGRPELIVEALMKKIREEQPPKADKLNTLVDFALAVQNVCATLEQAELHDHLTNPTLIKELVDKLPAHFKIQWAMHKATIQNVTLSTLGTFLYNLATVISTVTEPSSQKERKNENKPKKDSNQENKSKSKQSQPEDKGSVFVHSESKSKYEPPKGSSQCKICGKRCQRVEKCPVFLSYDVDKRWKEMYNHKLCRKCLERHGRFCNQNKNCGINECIFKHHSLLHDDKKHSKEANVEDQPNSTVASNHAHKSLSRNVLLRIVPVKIHYKDRTLNTFAYQDDGSDITMVEASLMKELEIRGTLQPLCLLWTADIHRKEHESRCVKFEISGQNEFPERYILNDVRTVETLGLPIQTVIKDELIRKFPYLEKASLIDYKEAIPQILIGSDNASLNCQLKIIEGELNQPIASKTRIGWSIHGRSDNRYSNEDVVILNYHRNKCPCQQQTDEKIHQQVKDYFTVENFGVQASNVKLCSKEDEKALEMLKKFTKRVGNRYETGLLWRYDRVNLPDSYGMAKKRLQCLEKHKPKTINSINETIQDYIAKGYVSKLTDDELKQQNDKIWYLPIFAVTYPKKPDKIRTVFDAAAKVNGISLNSLLLKGPDQLASLLDILRRFREKRIAATGDIKEMFHQVRIRDEDKPAQRFLWRNGDTSKEPDQYVMNVMTFGATCSPTAAQFVKNLNASEFENESPRAVEAIVKNHYVDDLLDCEHSEEKMIELLQDVSRIHKHGGFEIRNFMSNSIEVMKQFGTKTTEMKDVNLLDISFGIERVLGMFWNVRNDTLTFSLKFNPVDQEILNGNRMPTKREVLKILMSIFDPLGLISHYLIHLKIILQNIWRSKMDWDDELSSDEIKNAWRNWLDILPNVEQCEIPRWYSTKMSHEGPNCIELHVFVDASEEAFTAVAYLRVEDDDGVDCVLVGSKARVTPLKYLSIPRKELQSGVLGTRLLTSICNAHTFTINRRQIWTDSTTLLSWIRSDHRKYHQFVAHRIGEILESTNLNEWRWVPSKQNVADEATKWTKTPNFQTNNRWFSGPDFLKLSRSEWPGDKVDIEPDALEEMKVHFAHFKLLVPILINSTRISNWNKMHRAVALARRYVLILRAKIKKANIPKGPISRDELIVAEKLIFRQAQYEQFTEEIVILKRNQELHRNQQKEIRESSPIYKCSPYLDEFGLLRVHGRIDLAPNVPYDTKRPIILPRNSKLTHLLVAHYHRIYHHHNHRTVYNELRQRFYIPRLRTVINLVKKECQKCKNRRAKPQPPEMADLPAARLAIGFRPFTFIGIDYFGPMYVTIGRRSEKRWGVMITCLTIRAIHMDIVYSLNTDSVRNFINTRGRPEEIYSDQGSNFKGMDNELKRLISELDVDKMATEFTTCYTKWCFIPPASSHMAGSWERMIKSAKICLDEILPERHPTEDMLRSLLLEVVNIINSRPLTFIPLEHDDDEILTPNHFILGSSNGIKPMIPLEADGPILRSKWKENQRLADLFWVKFVKEFLPDLTRRTKWYQQVEQLKVGDIVLMVEETNSRNQYPKAIVLDTFVGSNNQVRRAQVQKFAYDGSKLTTSILWRPAHSLAKLDVHRVTSEGSLPVLPGNSQTGGSVMNDGNTDQRTTPAQPKNTNSEHVTNVKSISAREDDGDI